MIQQHIQDLIVMSESLPRSANRNRLISHLNDALAHAKVIEQENLHMNKTEGLDELKTGCTCPMFPSAIDPDCPIHKNLQLV